MSGVVFTPAAADRIGRAVRWVESRRQAGDQPAGPGRGVEPVWVRLTSGTADGDGHYPGVITLYSGVAEAWSDYSAVKVAPLNGETLSNATRYAVRPSGRTPGGDELYTVIGTTVAAGTIAVEAADGTPAYASVTKLAFDQADGFSLSNPSAGVAAVGLLPATESQAGIVSTAAQTFGGRKSFPDGTLTGDLAIVCSTDAHGNYGVMGGAYCVSAYRQAAGNYDLALTGLLDGSNVSGHTDQLGDGIWDENEFQNYIEYRRDLSGGGGAVGGEAEHIKVTTGNLWFYATKIWVSESGGGAQQCATGTLGDGSDVVNGLITTVGGTIDGGTW